MSNPFVELLCGYTATHHMGLPNRWNVADPDWDGQSAWEIHRWQRLIMKKKYVMYPIHNVHVDYVLKGQYFGHGLN